MNNELHELAKEFMRKNERNFYASDIVLNICIFNHWVGVESIWQTSDKVYIHCGCGEFEAYIDIDSLSDSNQEMLMETFKNHI